MNFTVIGVVLAAALLTGGWGGYKATRTHYEYVIAGIVAKAAAEVAQANDRAAAAAGDYEAWKAKQRPRVVTITREVEREVLADADCSARAIPDGLRVALTSAGADADQPQPDRALPAAPAASAGDVGGLGAGLRGLFGGTKGLPSAASSPR